MHLPHIHKPKLTRKQAVRVLWGFFALAIVAEAGLAYHALTVHDVVGGGLVLTAWCRETVVALVEHVAESLA